MAQGGGLGARLRRQTRAALEALGRAGQSETDILAISDLHLGSDLRRGAVLVAAPRQDASLAALLDHHADGAEPGRRWRLVIAGDMVDFIGMTVAPAPGEAVAFTVTAEERLCGLAPEPAKAVWKLARVVERHRLFCRSLAAFVARGHELVIIRGNHDQEWGLPEVQQAFVRALADFAFPALPGARRRDEAGRAALRRRIRFCEWFHLEPGRLYVEHGHAHDEYSRTDDLARGRPDGATGLPEPVSTLALRYFGNRHDGLDPNEVDSWTLVDYLRWAVRGGRFWRAWVDYLAMCGRLMAFSVRASARVMSRSLVRLVRLGRGLGDERLARLRSMVGQVRADPERLARDLAAVLRPPAEQSVLAVARMLYVDRLLLALGVAAGIAGCAASSAPAVQRAGALVAVLAVAAVANALLARVRLVDSHPKLWQVAHRMAVLFGVDYVVMGHSHKVVDAPVGDGSRYFNLGTWLSPGSEAGGPPSFPYLVVRRAGATLRRWPVTRTTTHVA